MYAAYDSQSYGNPGMNWLNIVGIAVALAMDALAVSISVGMNIAEVTRRQVFRIAFYFGLFQFIMPILGWLVGATVSSSVAAYGHWLAFVVLSLVGGKMLLDARSERRIGPSVDPTRGWMLVALSVATSLDAFAVGVSMAFMQVSVLPPSIVIGLVAAVFSAAGIAFANRILRGRGRAAAAIGAGVMILTGIRILTSHRM